VKVALTYTGTRVFDYDGEYARWIREAVRDAQRGEAPSDLYDITDTHRSDSDPEEHLAVTDDDGTVLWSGWLGTDLAAPGTARDQLAALWEQAADARQAETARLMAEGKTVGAAVPSVEAAMLRECARQLRALTWEGQGFHE
jgi:hypothetical protein